MKRVIDGIAALYKITNLAHYTEQMYQSRGSLWLTHTFLSFLSPAKKNLNKSFLGCPASQNLANASHSCQEWVIIQPTEWKGAHIEVNVILAWMYSTMTFVALCLALVFDSTAFVRGVTNCSPVSNGLSFTSYLCVTSPYHHPSSVPLFVHIFLSCCYEVALEEVVFVRLSSSAETVFGCWPVVCFIFHSCFLN